MSYRPGNLLMVCRRCHKALEASEPQFSGSPS